MFEARTHDRPKTNSVVDTLRTATVSSLAALATMATLGQAPAQATPTRESFGAGDCAPYYDTGTYKNHEGEACFAYVQNSANASLQPFYKFGNNIRTYLSGPTRLHFESRFWAGPRKQIEDRVGSWAQTRSFLGNQVRQSISVKSVSANLKADRALIRTRESWKVSDGAEVLYSEASHNKDITMCRGKQSGHPLHEWVVVKFKRDPTYDCLAFNKRNGIKS